MAKTALITGATSGIGYEFAKLFARDRHDLVLVARSAADLARVAGEFRYLEIKTATISSDLSKAGAAQEVFDAMRSQSQKIDFLVNNAGYALYGPFAQSDVVQDLANMQLNMVSLVWLTRLFLDEMIASREGRILNVASTAAFQPGPLMALYYAGKAFVLSFSEALAFELKGSGVTVTALCPGPTATGFQDNAQMHSVRLVSGRLMEASAVAKIGYDAMMAGKPVVISGFANQLMALGSKLAPRGIPIRVVNRLHQPVDKAVR